MKIFMFILCLGVYSHADSDFSILPVKMKCTSKALSRAAKKFEITDMDSDRPDSSFSDASFMDISLTKKTYSASFSNQCDNSYGVTFKVADLVKFKEGKYRFVTGKLEYFDSWLGEARGDEDETENETVDIFCTR